MTKRENPAWQESSDLLHVLSTHDGRRVSVEVVPKGIPTQDWDVLSLIVYPFGWLRHCLLHRGEYTVVVLEQRRHGWLDKTLHRTSGLTLEEAKDEAKRLAVDMSNPADGGEQKSSLTDVDFDTLSLHAKNSDQAVLDVLEAIANAEQALGDLARRLRERPDVREVVRWLNFGSGPSVDFSTTAELTNGQAVSWGVELAFKDGEWVLESSVRRNHARGEDAIRQLPTRHAVTNGELVQELLGSVHMVVAVWSDTDPMFAGEGYGE